MAYPGDGAGLGADDLQPQIRRLQQTLHDLGASIALAVSVHDDAAAAALRQQFAAVKSEVDRLVAQQYATEMPSALATWAASAGDALRGLGGKLALVAGLGLAFLVLGPAVVGRQR